LYGDADAGESGTKLILDDVIDNCPFDRAAPGANLAAVTAESAILTVVTALAAISAATTVPSAIEAAVI
jgi:N-acetylglucosamine kinase-like BadF-type ATPase